MNLHTVIPNFSVSDSPWRGKGGGGDGGPGSASLRTLSSVDLHRYKSSSTTGGGQHRACGGSLLSKEEGMFAGLIVVIWMCPSCQFLAAAAKPPRLILIRMHARAQLPEDFDRWRIEAPTPPPPNPAPISALPTLLLPFLHIKLWRKWGQSRRRRRRQRRQRRRQGARGEATIGRCQLR